MKRHDPVEIIKIGIPVLIEAVAVTIMIGCAMMLFIIMATSVPA
jgi:hypothetical protein